MSSNRIMYDSCTQQRQTKESVSILGYIMNPMRYEHKNKCRHELGLVSGPAVSHVQGNLVDLESELRGQTRQATMCAGKQHAPSKSPPPKMEHLPRCQMIAYKPVPLPPSMELNHCRK